MMTPAQIRHAANAIWHLREHGDQIAERDAMREELEATRSRRIEPMSAEEYERRKEIEEQRLIRELERGESSLSRQARCCSFGDR